MKKAIIITILLATVLLLSGCDVNTFHSFGGCNNACIRDGFNNAFCKPADVCFFGASHPDCIIPNDYIPEGSTPIGKCLYEEECLKEAKCKCYCWKTVLVTESIE